MWCEARGDDDDHDHDHDHADDGRREHDDDDGDAFGDDRCRDARADDDRRTSDCATRARGTVGRRRREAQDDGPSELRRRHVLVRSEEEVNKRVKVGLGLRWEFIDELLQRARAELPFDFLEISPENYIGRGGYYPAALSRCAATIRSSRTG